MPDPSALVRARRLVPVALAVLAFVVYAWFTAPGPYWLDSQELGAAGVQLGSPHPTGFPVFCVLARAASLFPFGELAWRVHMVSAVCAALAVGLTARLSAEIGGDDATAVTAGAGAGVLLGASATVFRQATVTEVYTPTLLLLVLAAWLAVRVARGGDRRVGLALCLVSGVGVAGVHASFRLLLALPVLALLIWRLRAGARWVLAAPALGTLGALGTLVYLPLRSASGHAAVLDWGHPQTFGALWDHAVVARRIRDAYAGEMAASSDALVGHARRFVDQLEYDLGAVALVAAGVGALLVAWRVRPRFAAFLLLVVAAGDFLYAIELNPMGLADRQNGVPLAFALAMLAAVGVTAAARRFGRGAPFAAAMFATIVAAPAAFSDGAARAAVAASDAPRAWAESGLLAAPGRAIALVQNDSTAAGMLWLTTVEAARPDAALLVRQHLWDVRTVRAVLARAQVARAGPGAPSLAGLAASGRPLVWELGVDRLPEGSAPSYGVPLARVERVPAGTALAAIDAMARVFGDALADGDENSRRQHGAAWLSLGRQALLARAPDAAVRFFENAARVDPRSAAAWINLGVMAASAGDHARAASFAERALVSSPDHVGALVNAARARLALGQDAAARVHAARATRLDPARAAAWSLLGTLAARAGDHESARRHYLRALARDPQDEDARVNLPKLRE